MLFLIRFFQVMLMEMQITANSTTSTNNDLIKGKSTITDIGKEKDQKNSFFRETNVLNIALINQIILTTTCITSDSCTLAFNFPKTKDSPPDLTNVENRLKLVNPAADCFFASLLIELTSPMLPPNAEFFGASNPPEDV